MHGLSKYEAEQLLKKFGYNELPSAKPKNLLRIALEVIKEPMFLLLLACASIYLLVGDHTEGVIMFFSIVLIISITFYQYRKTEKALLIVNNVIYIYGATYYNPDASLETQSEQAEAPTSNMSVDIDN